MVLRDCLQNNQIMVDLVGIEPTTSSMPFSSTKCSVDDSERDGVILRGGVHAAWSLSAASYVFPSDTERY